MVRKVCLAGALAATLLAAEAAAEETVTRSSSGGVPSSTAWIDPGQSRVPARPKTVCELIEEGARTHRLPVEFFTRLIWQESSFRSDAISPKGAQGIAQFMPATAALRGLADPFDPNQAIAASAEYLSELSARFGNLGLAAAAYNAGEKRVAAWLAGESGLPAETRGYVLTITGRPADHWTVFNPNAFPGGRLPWAKAPTDCVEVAAILSIPGGGRQRAERAPGTPRAPWAPWGVQVAGNFSLDRAMVSYNALKRQHPKILGSKAPMVVRTVNRSRGQATLFQIRAPAQTRADAEKLCQALQTAGAACIVLRNST